MSVGQAIWRTAVVTAVGSALGFGLGVGAGLLESRVYFLFLYPVAIGVILGVAMGLAVYLSRCALPRVLTGVAVLVSLVVLLGTWVGRYQAASADFAKIYRDARQEGLLGDDDIDMLGGSPADIASNQEVDDAWQGLLREETDGDDGLLGFMVLRAGSGLRIVGMAAFDLSEPLVLGVWSLEWLVTAGLIAFFTMGVARTPFCPRCRRWYVQERVGRAPLARLDALVEALRQGDVAGLHDLLRVKTTSGDGRGRPTTGPVEVVADHCPRCDGSAVHLKVLRPSGVVAIDQTATLADLERLRAT